MNPCKECGMDHLAWEACGKRTEAENKLAAKIAAVDVVFVIDTTSSMGPWIAEARRQARVAADAVIAEGEMDARFAVVEYRDHPPQEFSFVTRIYPFDTSAKLQPVLDALQPVGGGDTPEAVWDGVKAAIDLPGWREDSDRRLFLIGDSPPHGFAAIHDHWPQGCPCGLTRLQLTNLLNEKHIIVHAISVARVPSTTAAFRELAESVGGECVEVQAPEQMVREYIGAMEKTSGDVGFVARINRVYRSSGSPKVGLCSNALAEGGWTDEEAAANMKCSVKDVAKARAYANKRGLDKDIK